MLKIRISHQLNKKQTFHRKTITLQDALPYLIGPLLIKFETEEHGTSYINLDQNVDIFMETYIACQLEST